MSTKKDYYQLFRFILVLLVYLIPGTDSQPCLANQLDEEKSVVDQKAQGKSAQDRSVAKEAAAKQDSRSEANSPWAYRWSKDKLYICAFEYELEIPDDKIKYSGSVIYSATPSQTDDFLKGMKEQQGSGTGFVVSPDGIVATCSHVVQNTSKIEVILNGQKYAGKILDQDGLRDVALVKIEAKNLPFLPLADSAKIEMGQGLLVAGYPLSDVLGDSVKIAMGNINGIVDDKDNRMFQTDAPINPGNSGGPAVDNFGCIIGVAKSVIVGQSVNQVGLVIPSSAIMALMERNKIKIPAAATADLKATELVKKISPSVAMIKVSQVPGNLDAESRRSINCMTVVRKNGSRYDQEDSSDMLADAFGNMLFKDDEVHQPLLLGGFTRLGLETLPQERRDRWVDNRKGVFYLVNKEEKVTPSNGYDSLLPHPIRPPHMPPMPPAARFGPDPRFRGNPYLGSSGGTTREILKEYIAVPIVENVAYRLKFENDRTSEFQKEYSLICTEGDKDSPPIKITSEGKLIWDKVNGFPQSLTMEGTIVHNEKNLTIRLPFKLSYETTIADSVDVNKPSGLASPASPNAEAKEPAPRNPVRKIEPDQSPRASKKSDLDKVPASSGLKKYHPDN